MTSNEIAATFIAREDWDLITELITMRLPSRDPEAERLAHIRALTARMNELSLALARFAERVGALCEMPRAIASIGPETAALEAAMCRYAASIAAAASEFRPVVRGPSEAVPS